MVVQILTTLLSLCASFVLAVLESILKPMLILVGFDDYYDDDDHSPTTSMTTNHPLELVAAPGLITILDITLCNSVEYEITSTITSSHNLLATLLLLKKQAKRVLKGILTVQEDGTSNAHNYVLGTRTTEKAQLGLSYTAPQLQKQQRLLFVESFARSCIESASCMIQQLTTDSFAESANLCNPYKSISTIPYSTPPSLSSVNLNNKNNTKNSNTNTSSNNNSSSSSNIQLQSGTNAISTTTNKPPQQQQQRNVENGSTVSSSSSHTAGASSYTMHKQSIFDTGRHTIPRQQNPKECWETSRLVCPDYVNFDDSFMYCYKHLHQLVHHPYIVTTVAINTTKKNITSSSTGTKSDLTSNKAAEVGTALNTSTTTANISNAFPLPWLLALSNSYNTSRDDSTKEIDTECSILVQVLCHDLPIRLIQFKSALESNSDILQKLYLIKNEYRAPFRAYLESRLSVQRSPYLGTVNECIAALSRSSCTITTTTNAGDTTTSRTIEQIRINAKNKLQSLLETPELIELVSLEQQIEEYEIDIAKQLYPFTELSRYFDSKRVQIQSVKSPTIAATASVSLFFNNNNSINEAILLAGLRQTLYRLKNILVAGSKGSNATSNISLSSSFIGSNSEKVSNGIRPLLLDLQGFSREDEIELQQEKGIQDVISFMTSLLTRKENCSSRPTNEVDTTTNSSTSLPSFLVEDKLDQLLKHLDLLRTLCCQTPTQINAEGSFRLEQQQQPQQQERGGRTITEEIIETIPAPIVRGCVEEYDPELFQCQIYDWFTMVQKQHILAQTIRIPRKVTTISSGNKNNANSNNETSTSSENVVSVTLESLAEMIRHAEFYVSLSSPQTTMPALEIVRNRLEQIGSDHTKRFAVLKQIVETVCIRDMNLAVSLSQQPIRNDFVPSSQDSTRAKKSPRSRSVNNIGFFTIPLQIAGETLPIV